MILRKSPSRYPTARIFSLSRKEYAVAPFGVGMWPMLSQWKPGWRYSVSQSSSRRRRSEVTTCFSSTVSRRKKMSWNSGLLRSSLTWLPPAATRPAPALPFLLQQRVRIRLPWFGLGGPGESPRNLGMMRLLERPELALRDHRNGSEPQTSVLEILQLEGFPGIPLPEGD